MTEAAVIVFFSLAVFLAALETALLAVSRIRVRHAAAHGGRRGLSALLRSPEPLLAATVWCQRLARLAAWFAVARLVVELQQRPWLLAAALAPAALLTLAELALCRLAHMFPFRWLRACSPALWLLHQCLGSWLAPPRKPAKEAAERREIDRAEFQSLTDTLSADGDLGDREKRLIQRALALSATPARSLAKSIDSVVHLPAGALVRDCAKPVAESSHDFALVEDRGWRWVSVADVLREKRLDRPVTEFAKPCQRLDSSASVMHVARQLRQTGAPCALVEDGTAHSVVALDDLVGALLLPAAAHAKEPRR